MFLPYKDDNPTKSQPIVTIILISLNVLVFLIFSFGGNYHKIVRNFGFTSSSFKFYTPLTSLFLHGGLTHLIGNMWYLWIFGDNIEDLMGKVVYPIFYFLTGIVSIIVYTAFLPQTSRNIPLIGASGAISGILGAYLVLFPYAKVNCLFTYFLIIKTIKIPAIFILLFWFLLQLIYAYVGQGCGTIAYMAHIGGFAFGAGILYILIYTGMVKVKHRESALKGEWAEAVSSETPSEQIEELIERGKTSEAIKFYEIFTINNPSKYFAKDTQWKVAELLKENKKHYYAIEAYKKFCTIYSEDNRVTEAIYKIGKIYSRGIGDFKQAIFYFRQVFDMEKGGKFANAVREEISYINQMIKLQKQ